MAMIAAVSTQKNSSFASPSSSFIVLPALAAGRGPRVYVLNYSYVGVATTPT